MSNFCSTVSANVQVRQQLFLTECLHACFELNISNREALARFFPEFVIQEMCIHTDFLIAGFNSATPLTVTSTSFALHQDYYLLVFEIALETKRLEYRDLIRKIPIPTLVRHAKKERLWSFIVQTRFWENSLREQENYDTAAAFMSSIIQAGLSSGILTHKDLIRRLNDYRFTQQMHWAPTTNRLASYCATLVDLIPLDILYFLVLVPLANSYRWNTTNFPQDEIPTTPALHASNNIK
ncbi:hypothetical protein IT408_00355 [Candidatus Uhrbacteria bacterium]|nr:hypothetical protein [Candidatus Uhrbacteria bacterium]